MFVQCGIVVGKDVQRSKGKLKGYVYSRKSRKKRAAD